MVEGSENPEGKAGWQPPASSSGQWLPPAPPGPPPAAPPGAPPGWRKSPRAVDLDPNAPPGPEPWADPGNSVAGVALGMSVAAFGLLTFNLGLFTLPLAIAGTVLSWIGRGRVKRGETRQGKVEVAVGLAVGVATVLISVAILIAYNATH
jgi:hypothetical protein